MDRRRILHQILIELLGSNYVYFQPPTTIQMVYPCIIYALQKVDLHYANNFAYCTRKCYQVTVIDRNPDSTIPDKVILLPLCSFDRRYAADNLNHSVFTLYF